MNELEENIKITVEGCGVKLYDIVTLKENSMNVFRIYITSEEGINLDKCAEVSRTLSPLLDVYEPLAGKYNLEVSSPGIERKLKKPIHFQSSINEKVKIKNFDKDIIDGKIISADDEKVQLETKDGVTLVNYEDISSASTYFEW